MSDKQRAIAFLRQMKIDMSINFPEICGKLGYQWFGDIHDIIAGDKELLALHKECLQHIKYDLLQRLLQVGQRGRIGPSMPNGPAIRVMVDLIDSGALTPKISTANQDNVDDLAASKLDDLIGRLDGNDDEDVS